MDLIDEIVLVWTPPKNINTIVYNGNQVYKGIYIWGFTIRQKFVPYYVGEALNMEYRLLEHANAILGGEYCIHDRATLDTFYKNNNGEVTGEDGLLYYPNSWPYGFNNFLSQLKNLRPHIDYMIETMTFSYAIIEDLNIGKNELRGIENICINSIGRERLWNKKSGKNSSITVKHSGSNLITNLFQK